MESGLVPEKPALTRPSQNGSALGLLGLALFTSLLLSPAVAGLILLGDPTTQPCSDLALSIVLWAFWLALWPNARHACLVAAPLLIVTPSSVDLMLSQHSRLSSAVVA